jgi:predicted transposase YdaD
MEEEKLTATDLTLTHDDYFQVAFRTKRLAGSFLKKSLPKKTIRCLDLKGLVIEKRHMDDDLFKGVIADVVYRVPVKGTQKYVSFFVILEHKSYQDFLTVFQLWGYVYTLCRREFQAAEKRGETGKNYRLPPVVAIIVHHGETRFRGKTELSELFFPLPGVDDHLPKLQAMLFDLSSIADDDPILNDPEVPELKAVLMVLKIVFRRDVGLKIKDVLEELKPISDDPAMRRLIRATWIYLANNAKYAKRNLDNLLGTFQGVVGEKVMSTLVEMWKAEGEARGEARGRAEGRAEGEAKGTVLAFLRVKFKKVPPRIENAVRAMVDLTALQSLAIHAENCKSLEEFAKALP